MNCRETGWRTGVVAFLLGIVALGVFWPATHHEFIEFDDPEYVTANPVVQQGLTWAGLKWALQPGHAANWHPLTWWSHMLDVQLFGLDAGCHHLVNILLHTLTSILLFLLLHRVTRALWRSALVAALFAVHPLHVESVAWIAERKDVLSGLFFVLTLSAYVRYVAALNRGNTAPGARRLWFGLSLGMFALGLMSKPMLVTLPFLLLLLDMWPLERLQLRDGKGKGEAWRGLLVEKIPFLLLCVLSCSLTLTAQTRGRAVASLEVLPLAERGGNALCSYVKYLGQTFWPVNLAVFYPHPGLSYAAGYRWTGWQVTAGVSLLLLISAGAWLNFRRAPWLAIGWCWFLGLLVPVIGLVQVGAQAMADRYTYLPLIGIFIACSWTAGSIAGRGRFVRFATAAASLVIVGACAVLTRNQLHYWRNGVALYAHARAVTQANPKVDFGLGQALLRAGRTEEAVPYLRDAIVLDPGATEAHYALAMALKESGQAVEAVDELQQVLALVPGHENAGNALEELLISRGVSAMRAGQTNDAAVIFEVLVAARGDVAERNLRTGLALAGSGQLDIAISNLTLAAWLKPNSPEALPHLAMVLQRRGRFTDAALQFKRALELNPDQPAVAVQLAWLLATAPVDEVRDGNVALRLVENARRASKGEDPSHLLALAAAYAELGRFEEAVTTAEQSRVLAERTGMSVLAKQSDKLRACFEAKKPFRQATVMSSKLDPP